MPIPIPKKKVAEDFRERLSHPDKNKNDLKNFRSFYPWNTEGLSTTSEDCH